MDFNPLNQRYNELQRSLSDLLERKQNLTLWLGWYHNVDIPVVKTKIRFFQSEKSRLTKNLEIILSEIAKQDTDIHAEASFLRSLLNPRNWFAKDQGEIHSLRSVVMNLS